MLQQLLELLHSRAAAKVLAPVLLRCLPTARGDVHANPAPTEVASVTMVLLGNRLHHNSSLLGTSLLSLAWSRQLSAAATRGGLFTLDRVRHCENNPCLVGDSLP